MARQSDLITLFQKQTNKWHLCMKMPQWKDGLVGKMLAVKLWGPEFENPKPMPKTKQNKKSQAFFLFVIPVLLQQNGRQDKGES